MTSVVVQDNPQWQWLIPINTKFALGYFQKSGMVDAIYTYKKTFSNMNSVIKMYNA